MCNNDVNQLNTARKQVTSDNTDNPKSLQNRRNTKKLSLQLNAADSNTNFSVTSNSTSNIAQPNSTTMANTIISPLNTSYGIRPRSATSTMLSTPTATPPALGRPSFNMRTRNSEASIYTLGKNTSKNNGMGSSTISKPVIELPFSASSVIFNNTTTTNNNNVSLASMKLPKRGHSLSLSITTSPKYKSLDNNTNTLNRLETPINKAFNTKNSFIKKTFNAPNEILKTPIETSNNNIQSNYFITTPKVQQNSSDNCSSASPEEFVENAYPNGPLLVISPNIYLYSEPSINEVLQFDVVINVAYEIKNLKSLIPENSNIDYFHVLWKHHSKIFKDLRRITSLMNKFSKLNKKILVHCQCGISRSASLIVAYKMRYQKLTLNDAYDDLKRIAKQISPNMGLIFQLTEWNKYLTDNNYLLDMDNNEDDYNDDVDIIAEPMEEIDSSRLNDIIPKTPTEYMNQNNSTIMTVGDQTDNKNGDESNNNNNFQYFKQYSTTSSL